MRSTLTTIILICMLLGIAVGYACHTLWPDPAAAKSISDYISLMTDIFLRLIKMIIAPLVFSTLVVGVAHMGDPKIVGRIGGKAMLWFISASLVSLLLGLVAGQHPAPRRQPQPAAARRPGRDQSQGRLAVGKGFRRAPGAALDRRGDGDQRDFADRGVLAVLRRRLRGARPARPQAGRRHRGALPRHPHHHRLHHEAGAARGVRLDGRHHHHPGARHPGDLRQVRGRVLFRAGAVVVPAGRRRLRLLRQPRHAARSRWCASRSCWRSRPRAARRPIRR